MIGEGGKWGFYDSQKSQKGDITYFGERTGRILRENIKVCKLHMEGFPGRARNNIFMIYTFTISGRLKPIEWERNVCPIIQSYKTFEVQIYILLVKPTRYFFHA